MKYLFKQCVVICLRLESKLVLWRFKPKVVAVVGSVGKTSAKDAIYTALKDSLHIRKNKRSYGTEIGVPLTILGLPNAFSNYFGWLFNLFKGFFVIFSTNYPKWIVVEVSINKPGDMEYIASWLKPDVVVLTNFPDVPVHVENFDSPEEVIEEKKKILDYVKFDGTIVANADDEKVLEAAYLKRSEVKEIITYGFSEKADITLSNETIIYDDIDGQQVPTGMSLKVNHEGNSVPLALHGVVGVQHAYPVASAIATGIAVDVSVITMMQALQYHRPPKGRMNIIDGKNRTTIVDDSYNASPAAMSKAIEVLAGLETKGAKIAVLGDMLEIGRFTAKEHKNIGRLVAEKKIDYVFAVGLRSSDILLEAIEGGIKEDQTFHFDKAEEVSEVLEKFMNPGAVVLVKGSQGMRMEKVIEEIMKYPEQKKDFLVRQGSEWQDKV